jgi:hypothetical protein
MRIWTFCLAALALTVPAGTVWGGLITNGDFESGNTGFTTQYTYTTDLSTSGTIVVGIDPREYNPLAASYGDHTTTYGRMLIANGAEGTNVIVWEQTVSVTPNTEYVFCYWLSNWTDNDIRLAEIKCMINGVQAGVGWAPAATGEWTFVFHRWNSGANSTATIRLIDRDRAGVSNDFAIDDIDLFDIGDDYLLVAYPTQGGSVISPGEGVFIYSPGESVDLEAQCKSGYEFAGWGGNIFGTSHIMRVDMNGDRVVIAQFKPLDYDVTMQASGSAPNAFSTCAESADRPAVFQAALDSLNPGGLIVGERKGVCGATYLFPILKPKAGVMDITKVAVNVYGGILSAGPGVRAGDSGPFTRMIWGDLHQTFTGKALVDLLGQADGSLYWLPVEVNALIVGALDLADVYVSYDCPSVPTRLLRRFHDHLSIYQALENYARASDIRDLYNLRANQESGWETIVQTTALAQDLAGSNDTLRDTVGAVIEGFDALLTRWQSLDDSGDLTALARSGSEMIVIRLDAAASSGKAYIAAYADAIADGRVLADEASLLDQTEAQWKADMIALDATMNEVFRSLGDAHRSAASPQLRDAAEKMIRAMAPWRTGEPDEYGFWIPTSPSYLEEAIQSLQGFPPEDIAAP